MLGMDPNAFARLPSDTDALLAALLADDGAQHVGAHGGGGSEMHGGEGWQGLLHGGGDGDWRQVRVRSPARAACALERVCVVCVRACAARACAVCAVVSLRARDSACDERPRSRPVTTRAASCHALAVLRRARRPRGRAAPAAPRGARRPRRTARRGAARRKTRRAAPALGRPMPPETRHKQRPLAQKLTHAHAHTNTHTPPLQGAQGGGGLSLDELHSMFEDDGAGGLSLFAPEQHDSGGEDALGGNGGAHGGVDAGWQLPGVPLAAQARAPHGTAHTRARRTRAPRRARSVQADTHAHARARALSAHTRPGAPPGSQCSPFLTLSRTPPLSTPRRLRWWWACLRRPTPLRGRLRRPSRPCWKSCTSRSRRANARRGGG
jgi:hypothetical protein